MLLEMLKNSIKQILFTLGERRLPIRCLKVTSDSDSGIGTGRGLKSPTPSNLDDTISILPIPRHELDQESQVQLDMLDKAGALDASMPIDFVRGVTELAAIKYRGDFDFTGTKEELEVSSSDNSAIPITVLRPSPSHQDGAWSNIMVFFHGGGFVYGSRETHMAFCEMICGQVKSKLNENNLFYGYFHALYMQHISRWLLYLCLGCAIAWWLMWNIDWPRNTNSQHAIKMAEQLLNGA